MEFFKTIAGRLIATWIAAGVSYLGVKYGITVDTETQKAVAENLVGIVVPTFMTLYAVGHKVINKRMNPGDAASTHIAAVESKEHAQLLAHDKN